MASAVFLSLVLLFCKANSQLYNIPGPIYPGNPGFSGSCASGPGSGPYALESYLPNTANIEPVLQTISTPGSITQSILNNIPATSLIQNQIPSISNFINPLLGNSGAPYPQAFNVPQLAPSVFQNSVPFGSATSPVVANTIVDNTLANSLANTIQLLIVSNLIENTLGSGVNIAETLSLLDSPCVNNFEVVTPDFYPTQVNYERPCIDTYSPCNNEVVYQEPAVFQPSCGTNFVQGFGSGIGGGSFGIDNCGCNNFGNTVNVDSCSNLQFGPSPAIVPTICSAAPMALEVPFPASIPAQLTCNFGFLSPTNTPCVSFNVDPVPLEGYNSFFSNFGNGYIS